MSLAFFGPKGSLEVRWIVYALLRDNVQHYLEGGTPTDRFAELHRLGEALVKDRVRLRAQPLRSELEQAKAALLHRPAADIALSGRTRAVLSAQWPPSSEETAVVGKAALNVPLLHAGIQTMADAFGNLVDELLEITAGATENDWVEVVDQ
jgi:hypothetical protein